LLSDSLIQRVLRLPADFTVYLGSAVQPGSIYARLESVPLWRKQSGRTRLKSLISRRWEPDPGLLDAEAQAALSSGMFGGPEDFGDHLLRLNSWHQSRKWQIELPPELARKAAALEVFSVLTRLRLQEEFAPALQLRLAERAPVVARLVFPMVVKVPVVSFRFFLDVHASFALNSIHKSGHAHAGALGDYLYELLYLQQKVALSLHEFIRLVVYATDEKRGSHIIAAEVSAIMGAELVFVYLKATMEKLITLTGLTFGIADLDGKRTHRARLNALDAGVPAAVLATPYGQMLRELVSSENLDELNSYRSGILHKRGIADLQPHNYVEVAPDESPFRRILDVLREQHAKNAACLLCALALLTDELAKLDPPDLDYSDLPWPTDGGETNVI